MATIGSISVAFTADLKGLEDGIETIVDLFDDIADAADALGEKLDSVYSKVIQVKASIDTSQIDAAEKKVSGLSESVKSSASSVKITADTEQAQSSVNRLAAFMSSLSQAAASPRAAVTAISNETRAFAGVAEVGKDELEAFADSIGSVANVAAAPSVALKTMRSATSGVSEAIASWTSEYDSLESALDRTLVAVSRSQNAYRAASALVTLLSGSLGGLTAVSAAFAGSTAAAAISVGSLAGGVAGAVASLATYAVVSGAVRAATAGMSEEARRFVESLTALAATTVGIYAGLAASASTYRVVAGAIFSSTSASDALSKAFTRLSSAAAAAVQRFAPLASVLGTLSASLTLVAAASNENTSGSGFAALVAQVAATSAAGGAAIGAMTALAGGTGVLAGAAAGAGSAVASLFATFPVTATLAAAAAVATGRFSHELEELSLQAQQVDQMAERFGAPRREIEQLRLAAVNTGVGLGQLAKGQQTFYTSLSKIKAGQLNVENVREAKLAFDRLGISLEEVKNARPEEVFRLVAEEISKVEDPAKRTQIAFDLFGKQGAAILPALKEFGELAADFDRLGGSVAEIDFQRFLVLENSFDRLKQSSANLGRLLLLPFVELQKAFNNLGADIRGGLAAAIAPLASLIADATKPLAVLVEIAGRIINIFLRIAGVAATLVSILSSVAGIADIFSGLQSGVNAALAPLESLVGFLQEVATAVSEYLRPVESVFKAIGEVIGFVVGGLAQLAVYAAIGAAVWGVYSAAVAVASGFSLTAAASFVTMWAAALGPFAPVIALFVGIGAAVAALTAGIVALGKWLYSTAAAFGLVGGESEKINASTASVEELAAAANDARSSLNAMAIIPIEVESTDRLAESIEKSRDSLGDLTIQSARFGQAGADAASQATNEFNTLQQKLADGQIDLPTFEEESSKIRENLEKNLEILRDDSPEVTLKKNLELFKQLDDAARSASKGIRDIGAGVQIGDTFFPRSDEVKARAAAFRDEYVSALEEIKKKQQAGVFANELSAKRDQNEQDFKSGKITSDQYQRVKLELDSTSAQEQASLAAEDAQREFDRKKVKLEADLSFADSIRKELETAFLSPVEKFQKELEKIRSNPELTSSEKQRAETNLRKQAREQLVGKDAQTQLTERRRDLSEGAAAGLITQGRADFEAKKAMDDFASAVGASKTPFEEFSGSLDNIAAQFGFAGQSMEEVRAKLSGTPEQLEIFDRAVKQASDNLLASLGVEKSPEQVFQEQMERIAESAASLTGDQRQQAEAAATRKRNSALGAGADLGGQFADRKRQIDEAFGGGKDSTRQGIATNRLNIDRRQAAGLDPSASQKLKAGADNIADVFGVTGKSIAEIQASLSPEEFSEFQAAMKKNADSAKESVGVQQSASQKLKEAQERLTQAVKDGVVSQEEASAAARRFKDDFMSSIGVTKTPFEEFSGSIDNISEQFGMAGATLGTVRESLKGNAEDLALFDRAVTQARDNLLESLGIEKSPQQVFEETIKKIEEAAASSDPDKRISKEEADQARRAAVRRRDEALGAGGTAQNFGDEVRARKAKIEEAYGVGGEKDKEKYNLAMRELNKEIPGAEIESPVQKFKDEMSKLDNLKGTLSPEDYDQRKKVLQAQLQEDMKPALDRLAPDRRQVESSDTRSKAGVDTFFRILRGNDNPSLKAQLEIARNTKMLAEAAAEPEAAPILANITGR